MNWQKLYKMSLRTEVLLFSVHTILNEMIQCFSVVTEKFTNLPDFLHLKYSQIYETNR